VLLHRLDAGGSSSIVIRVLVQSFPLSAWRSLDIAPLHAKSKSA
jgi:hypothetical protein